MPRSYEKELLVRGDEELVILIQQGDEKAFETLFYRYKGLIYEVSYRFMLDYIVAQMYFDDLIDVAIDGLFIATREFTINKDMSFLNYWWSIVERHQLTFLNKIIDSRIIYCQPSVIENTGVSLSDSEIRNLQGLESSIYDRITKNYNLFSQEEMLYLEHYLLGYKPLEIAEFLSWNKSKLYRIRKKSMDKLNKIFKSN